MVLRIFTIKIKSIKEIKNNHLITEAEDFPDAFFKFNKDKKYDMMIIKNNFFNKKVEEEFCELIKDYKYKDIEIILLPGRKIDKLFSYLEHLGFNNIQILPINLIDKLYHLEK